MSNAEARWYRHPFLVNATASGPLRQWFTEFVVALKAALPAGITPERFYLDSEPYMARPGAVQANKMLRFLMTDYYSTVWTNPNNDPKYRIPAWGNKTLEELYQEERARQVSELGAAIWPANAAAAAASLVPGSGPWDAANNSYTRWWEELTARVEDYVMWNCVYDVVHSSVGWPDQNPDGTYKVRCGNYDDFRCDGVEVAGRSGWVQDRSLSAPNAYWNVTAPVNPSALPYVPSYVVLTKSLPRSFVNTAWGGIGYYTNTGQRWLSTRRWAKGDVDSPYLYGIKEQSGDYAPHYEACRRNDLYGIPDANGEYPVETPWQTTIRMHRETVESSINSDGQEYGEKRMVPWIEMVGIPAEGEPIWERARTPESFRTMVCMLRGKNLAEMQLFTQWPERRADDTEFTQQEKQDIIDDSWAATSHEIRKVYSTRITRYLRLVNTGTGGGVVQPADDGDKNRLEFTLLHAGDPRSVAIRNDQDTTLMYVDFKIANADSQFRSGHQLDVRLEGWACLNGDSEVKAPFTGRILAWNYLFAQWEMLTQWDPSTGMLGGADTYTSDLPDGAFRVRFGIPGQMAVAFVGQSGLDAGKVKLCLVHDFLSQSTPGNYVSRYDLVQLTPGDTNSGTSALTMNALSTSDFDMDGSITPQDLDGFVEAWMYGHIRADIDLDETIDENDAATFIDAYVTGD